MFKEFHSIMISIDLLLGQCFKPGTGWKKGQKLLNVQDGIRPYRTEKQLKINNSYMYDYLIVKSMCVGKEPLFAMQ